MNHPIRITEGQIEHAAIERDADAEALRAALALIQAAEAAVTAIPLSAYRHATAVAGDDAAALLSLAGDEIRGALLLLERIELGDLRTELEDAADAARAESQRAAA